MCFVDKSCSPSIGVAWSNSDRLYPLRAPRRDTSAFDDYCVFHWGAGPPPLPRPPTGAWEKTKAFVENVLASEAEAQIAQTQNQSAFLEKLLAKHPDDGVNVALDVLAVGLSLALLPAGLGVLGVAALIGGGVVLLADSAAYGLELGGNDELAETIKRKTELVRIVATLAALPDGLVNGWKALKEIAELREAIAVDHTTASAAERLSSRTMNAARADRYKKIAERARLRAASQSEKIIFSLKHEIGSRAAGLGSAGFLIREEWTTDTSMFNTIRSRLQVHCTAVAR